MSELIPEATTVDWRYFETYLLFNQPYPQNTDGLRMLLIPVQYRCTRLAMPIQGNLITNNNNVPVRT